MRSLRVALVDIQPLQGEIWRITEKGYLVRSCLHIFLPSRQMINLFRGSIYPPTGPDHQISLTQIANRQKKPTNSLITKILMYYESVVFRLHSGHVENVSRATVTNDVISTRPHNDALKMYVLPFVCECSA